MEKPMGEDLDSLELDLRDWETIEHTQLLVFAKNKIPISNISKIRGNPKLTSEEGYYKQQRTCSSYVVWAR